MTLRYLRRNGNTITVFLFANSSCSSRCIFYFPFSSCIFQLFKREANPFRRLAVCICSAPVIFLPKGGAQSPKNKKGANESASEKSSSGKDVLESTGYVCICNVLDSYNEYSYEPRVCSGFYNRILHS